MTELNYLTAAWLGLVQGLTEFLPISSSGHLVVLQEWFGLALPSDQMVAFDVCLHLGSLLAIVIVFRKAIVSLLKNGRLIGLILLASIPAGLIGVGFEERIGEFFSSVRAVGFSWLLTGLILFATRWSGRGETGRSHITIKQAILIGCAQAVAILPGVSRSGSTIASGLFVGLSREFAGEFAFLLALPAIGGAALLKAPTILALGHNFTGPILSGTFISFVASYFALRLLLQFVRKGRLYWFGYYCWAIGITSLLISRG